MITADPSAAVLRPKRALISSDDAPMMITPIARRVGGRCAIHMRLGQDDHV
ncbi:MAG: hypothetical protein ABI471_03480 [Sphingomonas bacterium]